MTFAIARKVTTVVILNFSLVGCATCQKHPDPEPRYATGLNIQPAAIYDYTADCLCKSPDGSIEAYFAAAPTGIDQLKSGDKLSFLGKTCQAPSVCSAPKTVANAGSGNFSRFSSVPYASYQFVLRTQ
jgi:hypothetical protein